MKFVFQIVVIVFISIITINQNIAAQVSADGNEEKGFMVNKDPRLDLLDKRPELIKKALEEKVKATKAEEEIPTFTEINIGKKKVTGSITSKNGFRIVIYNGPDRKKALAIKNAFTKAFPGTHSYMSYIVPNFKIKVGDFEDKKEANQFLKKINTGFAGAFLTPDVVTVKNILVQ
jgi:hypothetical protein